MSDDPTPIQFPGLPQDDAPRPTPGSVSHGIPPGPFFGEMELSYDQLKAIDAILRADAFVCIGVKSTGSGGDFFVAIDGDADELAKAAPHLEQVLQKQLVKRGLL